MNQINIEKIVKNLIDTFINAGKISIKLRNQGLKKEIKSDNTPVSNGDIEVNTIITKKIKELTPNIPVISEETSENNRNIQMVLHSSFSAQTNKHHTVSQKAAKMIAKITWTLIHDCKFNEKIGNIFLVQIFNNRFLQVDGLKRQV